MEAGCDTDSTDMVFVSANAANIPDLAAFCGSCQPVWLILIEGRRLLQQIFLSLVVRYFSTSTGRLVEAVRGANAIKMRSTILRLWSEVVMAGAGDTVEAITMDQADPGEVWELDISLEILIHQFILRI